MVAATATTAPVEAVVVGEYVRCVARFAAGIPCFVLADRAGGGLLSSSADVGRTIAPHQDVARG